MNETERPIESGGTDKAGEVSITPTREEAPWILNLTRKDRLLPVGAFAIGILFVWLFYGKNLGISVPIFVCAFYSLLVAYSKPLLRKDRWFGWFLSIPVFMISLTFLLFDNEVLRVLNVLALFSLMLLQTLLITGANNFEWYRPGIVIDMLCGVFYSSYIHALKPFAMIANRIRRQPGKGRKQTVVTRVLAGLLISVPLLLILLALLASADMVFGELVQRLTDLFDKIELDELSGKSIVAFIIFLITFSYLWSLGHGDRPADHVFTANTSVNPQKRGWDPIIIITVTAAIDILYIVFVGIQFAYLFGRAGLPEGFTYSEYARSGFFELILVTLLNIGLLACTLTFTGKTARVSGTALRVLNTLMIGCTFVMLFSAYYRMSLYEEAYGYTFLRIMTQAFMAYLLVLFVITLARVWRNGLSLLKPYIIVSILVFTVVNYINVDQIIAAKNIERYYSTNVIDISYFNTLSNAIIGDVKKLTEDKDINVATAARELLERRKKQLMEDKCWQSFNLADYKARELLKE